MKRHWRMVAYPLGGAIIGASTNWAVRHFFGEHGTELFGMFILGGATFSLFWVIAIFRAEHQLDRELRQIRAEFFKRVRVPAELGDSDRG